MNEILKTYGINYTSRLTDIDWRAENSNSYTVLFYQYHKSYTSYETFVKRIKSSSYGLLITSGIEEKVEFENHFDLNAQQFINLQVELCKLLYPVKKSLKFIGVTGTNGKTTTIHIISQILKQKSINHLTIGTLGVLRNGVEVENFSMTTPPLIDLYKTLSKNCNDVDVVAMELSSHSLIQQRTKGIEFSSIGWTSFSQDHLDYHKDLESYFNAKLLIKNLSSSRLVVSEKSVDLVGIVGECKPHNISSINNVFLKTRYNQINLDVAVGCLREVGIEVCETEMKLISSPPGRFNVIESNKQTIIIDYAHTPDAIENICKEVQEFSAAKILTIFGCGGDRDKTKRSKMLAAASLYSDKVIVTSDNPRFEDPEQIIKDILVDNYDEKVSSILQREEAIKYGLATYPEHTILILGKGNEPYLDVMGHKTPYLDEKVVRDNLE